MDLREGRGGILPGDGPGPGSRHGILYTNNYSTNGERNWETGWPQNGKNVATEMWLFFRPSDTDGRFYTHWDRLVQRTSMWSSPIFLLKY